MNTAGERGGSCVLCGVDDAPEGQHRTAPRIVDREEEGTIRPEDRCRGWCDGADSGSARIVNQSGRSFGLLMPGTILSPSPPVIRRVPAARTATTDSRLRDTGRTLWPIRCVDRLNPQVSSLWSNQTSIPTARSASQMHSAASAVFIEKIAAPLLVAWSTGSRICSCEEIEPDFSGAIERAIAGDNHNIKRGVSC